MSSHRSLMLSVVVGLLALTTFVPARAAADDTSIVAIVNAKNSRQGITIHELRLMYGLYRRTWEGGGRVVLVLPEKGSPEMEFLMRRVFRRTSEPDVGRYYVQAVFQQRVVKAPPTLPSNAAITLVGNEEGAIALVSVEDVDATRGADVRVLTISD